MLKGFKEFLTRGNVVELAVAVIMGAAFGAVVTSLVKDIITPLIGKIFGKPDFAGIHPGGIGVGNFLNALIAFLFVAAGVYFMIVVPLNKLNERRKRGQVEEEIAPPEDTLLLRDIRDALTAQQRQG